MWVGDKVQWTSQSHGYHTTKIGTIMAIVSAGSRVMNCVPAGYCFRGIPPYSPRNHESYLVQVGNSTRLYWPRVKNLTLCDIVGVVRTDTAR